MKIFVPPVVRADIREILSETLKLFGSVQATRYAEYIDRTMRLLEDDPKRPSSRDRRDLARGVRSLHVSVAAGRVSGAAHVVFYREGQDLNGERMVTVIRILHEHASPKRHLRKTL